jgi:hypothetical protein
MKLKIFLLMLISITILSAQTRPPDKKLVGYNLALVTSSLNKAAAAVTGSGTANQIPYWTGTTTLGSLSTATYPSLTELARIKGITSAVQTQLNSKQATLVSGTNIRPINGQSLLGSANLVIVADTTGLWLKVYNIVKSQLVGETIIGTKATLDSMIVDFRKNNHLRLNK